MRIFSREPTSYRLNGRLPVDPETGLYSRNFFLLRLKEERERTKRNGSAFSLLIADVEAISTAVNGKSTRATQTYQKKLAEWFVQKSRKTDTKGWFDLKTVGILMPDTKNPGASRFKDKISNQLRQEWPGAETVNLEEFIRISTFPESSSDKNRLTPPNQGNGRDSQSNPENTTVYADILSRNLFTSLKRLAKRIFDIAGALFGIVIASPLMLIITVCIKLSSPGPAFFRQERIGLLGRRFTFLKFRSMVTNADQTIHEGYITDLINGQHSKINRGTETQPLYKINDDPRVTRLGHILRKTSLDELPQLFNILKGDMSIVGPRPPIPYELEKYRLWHCSRVFEVKPGLTGLWQVSGRSRTSFDDMVRLDLQYADHWSFWLDIKIILKTFRAVLSTAGAY